jgi:PAS domain S-box-containing protein/putative nucleotidyltransferase with HDIG domain
MEREMKTNKSKNNKKSENKPVKVKTDSKRGMTPDKNPGEFYEKLLITTTDAVEITDLDGNIIFASEHTAALFGAEDARMLRGKSSMLFIAPESREGALRNLKRVVKEGFLSRMEYTMLRGNGSRFPAEINSSVIMGKQSAPAAVLNTIHDVSKTRLTEVKLKKTEENYRAIFNAVNDGIIIVDPGTGEIVDANKKAYEMKGCTFEDLRERGLEIFMSPGQDAAIEDILLKNRAPLSRGSVHIFECFDKKIGSGQWVEVSFKREDISGRDFLVAIVRDITGRKKAEDELKQSAEMYRSLVDASPDAVMITDLDGTIRYASDKALEMYGAPSMDKIIGRTFINMAVSEEHDRAEAAFDSVKEKGSFHGQELKLLRYTGETIIGEANATLIRKPDSSPRAVQVTLRDVTKKKKMEDDLNQSYTAVKKIMDGIINAMEKLVEKKDLYTVGHQRRTAQLARAIAAQMGLPPEQINCVYISALIHDIGKIFVSGAILNKNGPLTAAEYDIIKQHPEAGYEVLKTIDFPWPIADIILQHHERLDGSGYPYGLKSERIYLESRIISVADVVEAITFARPYRPAFGIDKALEEIDAGKGRLYDPEVVDITFSLMKEQDFKFE